MTLLRACTLMTLLSLVLATTAMAQVRTDVPGERFRPSTTSHGILDVESAVVGSHLAWNVALWGGYALNPLVVYDIRNDERVGAFVHQRVGMNAVASLALFEWLEVAADLAFVPFQSSEQGTLPAGATSGIASAGLGDLRLAPKVRVLRGSEQGLDVAVIPAFTLPTGGDASFTGEGQATFVPELAVSKFFADGGAAGLKLAGNVQLRLRPEERVLLGTAFGNELNVRAGVGYRLHEKLAVPLELDVSGSLGNRAASFFDEVTTPAEVLAGLKYDVVTMPGFILQAFAGAGTSIGNGVGAPDVRVFGGVRVERPTEVDRDGDGIVDGKDACVDDAEDIDGFKDDDGCKDLDNDDDGIADAQDRCANDAEDKDGFKDDDGCKDSDNDEDGVLDLDDDCKDVAGPQSNKGCPIPPPPDGDGDGVVDGEDVCPTVAGKPHLKGCPDGDNDGIVDSEDKCPTEPETINDVDDSDGCPDRGKVLATLTKEQIVIVDKVFFDTGKATIKPAGNKRLDQVASILKAHGEIAKLRIEGHADDVGGDDLNLSLSKDRAEAVRAYLVGKGIDASRLEAEGYGKTRPAVKGTGAAAREKNRRVEFMIVR